MHMGVLIRFHNILFFINCSIVALKESINPVITIYSIINYLKEFWFALKMIHGH